MVELEFDTQSLKTFTSPTFIEHLASPKQESKARKRQRFHPGERGSNASVR